MNLFWQRISFSFRIAGRYLFTKKSHNAINVITAVSAIGVSIGTMALVVVMSVFNGFESLVSGLFSAFDPDLKIELKEGKSFSIDGKNFETIRKMEGVKLFTEVVQENALIRYNQFQMPAVVKGVSANYKDMVSVDSVLYDGDFVLFDGAFQRTIPGVGIATKLGLNPKFIDPVTIYAPKRTGKVNLLRPDESFNESEVYPSGVFRVKQSKYDDQYMLISLVLARRLFEYDSLTVTSVELKLNSGIKADDIKLQISTLLGPAFKVMDRYEQQESFFNIMQIEKWITYLILSFILLIATFNVIGSLSMLIIDKTEDIQTLESLGADIDLIRKIFLFEGWLISFAGAVLGIILGTGISLAQQYFKLLKLGSSYVTDAYPVVTSAVDILIVLGTVLLMGFLAALYPVRYIRPKMKSKNNK